MGDPHVLYGDVWPRDAQGDPRVFVPQHENAWYYRDAGLPDSTRGFGYLVQEAMNFLRDSTSVDFSDYDANGDGDFDYIFMVVRSDSLIKAGGYASLKGWNGQFRGPSESELVYDGITVRYANGSFSFVRALCFANSATPRGVMYTVGHEYGHKLWTEYSSLGGHLKPYLDNAVPENQYSFQHSDCVGGTCYRNAYEYNLMGGNPYNYTNGAPTLSAHERILKGWVDVADLTTSASNLTLPDLYTTGEVYRITVGSAGTPRVLLLANRQRVSWFDSLSAVNHIGADHTDYEGLMTTGLLPELSGSSGSTSSTRALYDVLAADNTLVLASYKEPYQGDLYGPDTKRQLTPWTRPNINGCATYADVICSNANFTPTWQAVDNIRYLANDPDSTLAFDFYTDFRTAPEVAIRADSWMGAETSGATGFTFTSPVRVYAGATLTIEAETDFTFADGLLVEYGGALVVEDGVTLRFGPGEALDAHGLLAVAGTASDPVTLTRQNAAQPWAGVVVRGDGSALDYAAVEGATVGVDLRAEGVTLAFVTLTGNGTGLLTDWAQCPPPGECTEPVRSAFTLAHGTVDGSTGVGVHARHTDAEISHTAITDSGSHGLLVDDADVPRFRESTVTGNGHTPGGVGTVTAGLAVVSGGGLTLGIAGSGAIPDPYGYNVVTDNAMHEAGVETGGTLVIGNPTVGGYNSIYKTSGSPGTNARYVANGSGVQVKAEDVWWGEYPPPSAGFVGSVDRDPALTCDWQGPPCQDPRLGASRARMAGGTAAPRSGDEAAQESGGEEGAEWLRQEIRRLRQALAQAPASPEARGHVLTLAQLQRLDRDDALGEHGQTWALLRQLRQALPAGGETQPAASAALRVEVQEALRTADFEGARALLARLGSEVEDASDLLALDLARVSLDEAAGDYASALAGVEAVEAALTEEQGLLAEALFQTAAVLARRLAGEEGAGLQGRLGVASSLLAVPAEYALLPAYPNPSTGATTLPFALPAAARVRVAVYDLLGRRVAEVADGPYEAGRHAVVLDGQGLTSGVYVVRAVLEAEGSTTARTFTRRVTLLR